MEQFLFFLPNPGHKSEELTESIKNTLSKLDIDIMNCRRQSYDKASNMSGIYSGVQARIKKVNLLLNMSHVLIL